MAHDLDTYDWHLAPICDAFAGTGGYPPPVTVNPAHVGYVVQRYVLGVSMGERVLGYFREPEARALADRLNANGRAAGNRAGVRIVPDYL